MKKISTLLNTSKVVGIEVNTERPKYVFMSHHQTEMWESWEWLQQIKIT
jgi:hypothetical protein